MRRRVAAGALGLVLAATTFAVVSGGAGAQTEGGGGEFGSFALTATAPGFEATEDEPSAQAHPEGHGAVPETSTLLSNGFGYGLATIAWPGATAANGGAVLGLLIPSTVPNTDIPVPDAVGQAYGPLGPSIAYPVRAEARAGTAPDASYTQFPGATMTAHADDARVNAEGSIQRAEQSGMATFGNVRSTSESVLSGALGRATANSSAQDIDVGGVIKIKSVTSTATAQTDGVNATATGATVVQGMTIADQPAYVDDQGVHIGAQGQPANAVANEIAAQALSGAGMQVYVSKPLVERSAGTAAANAGSLYVYWMPPGNPSGNVFTLTFGGARVSVAAGEGFGVAVAGEDTGGGESLDAGSTPSDLPAASDLSTGEAQGGVPVPAAGAVVGARSAGFSLAKTFGGFGWGWLLLGLALVAVAGAGARRVMGDLLERPALDCPLEGDR
jgi:hypothetical protein